MDPSEMFVFWHGSGSVWVLIPVSGSVWVLIPVSGSVWVLIPVSGSVRVLIPVSGSVRVLIPVSESVRVLIPVSGSVRVLILVSGRKDYCFFYQYPKHFTAPDMCLCWNYIWIHFELISDNSRMPKHVTKYVSVPRLVKNWEEPDFSVGFWHLVGGMGGRIMGCFI